MSSAEKKVRLTVDMTSQLDDKLVAIAKSLGLSKTEVIRRALVLMETSHEAARDGKHVGVTSKRENLEREFIGI